MKAMIQWMNLGLLNSFGLFLTSYAHCQPNANNQQAYPYSGGQAVFVQSPYNSSVYTEYPYSQQPNRSNRLPAYTTNQAVFVQQPYGTTPQRVASYPSKDRYARPANPNNYSTPVDFPSTTTAAYPFATVRSYTSSPYSTTTQYSANNSRDESPIYTNTQTYPFTTVRETSSPAPNTQNPNVYRANSTTGTYSTDYQTIYPYTPSNNINVYPSQTLQQTPTSYPSGTNNSSMNYQSPYPLSTALPQTNSTNGNYNN